MGAIAAAISLPLTSPTRRSLTASLRTSSTILKLNSLPAAASPRAPTLRVSAVSFSMNVEAVEKASPASFLDRREAGFLHFVKYHGLGNDFILVDNRDSSEPKTSPEQAAKLCDRNFGIGADGVIFALPGINGADYTMRIYNSDGSEPEMCGNGVRCFARFIAELENLQGRHSFKVHTGAGLIIPEIQEDGNVKVDMGEPILKASDVPTKLPANKDQSVVKSGLDVDGVTWNVTCVSMGNPHCVTFGTEGGQNLKVDELKLADIGPKFENHEVFPARTNTEFVQVYTPSHLKMRVWERGAGATLACGTGACAVVVAAVLEGRAERNCTVDLPGGPLQIEWKEENNCYTLNVTSRTRYLLRATFLYGNFDTNNAYPKFDISVGATHWSSIVISDANTIEMRELIFLAMRPTVSVCLSNATTGQPFISTLELRQFNGSMYYTEFEQQFYLSVSARINFGADDEAPVRYPDDPFDRIWLSDSVKKANYLVDIAAGTKKVSTKLPIDINSDERPPEKVMQTAVVGTNGTLTYRLNLDGFPGFGWAFTYFAEIEDLAEDESRKFRLVLPGYTELSKAVVNIEENAQGKYRLYEPGYTNLSFPFVLSFKFGKTSDSSRGPLLNAMEINKYLEINDGSQDGGVISSFVSHYSSADWTLEGGDPCLPVPWSWVECNSNPQPRIVKIKLSSKNITGNIPSDLTKLNGLEELWLDGNSLTGTIPDFTGCVDLKIIHLENNQLTGGLSSFTNLPSLKELYVQNNMLSGTVPSGLLDKVVNMNYTGNVNLRKGKTSGSRTNIIIGTSVGAAVLVIATIVSGLLLRKGRKKCYEHDQLGHPPAQGIHFSKCDAPNESAHCFSYAEIEEATRKFEKKIGSGGFGVVYYGKMKDEKEIAVKVLTSNSYQGKREFSNEVTLLSRIHHRNLVQFLGYCQEDGRSMLIYEFMHNGTLKEHLYGPLTHEQSINWIKRLEIAEDAAKGIEYLHTGCVPAIIHRDLKSSNILIDKHMRAKVSDFGLSKLAVDGASHVSSIVRGTVGYLDPEYYISQQLTDKSDVYSFGVILLELISGQEAISNENFGVNCRNIVQWAKLHIESGDIQGIIDPSLDGEYDIQSMWKIAEKALMCVQAHGFMRPSMSEVLKEIQDAISMERDAGAVREGNSDISRNSIHSIHSSLNMGSLDLGRNDNFLSIDESVARPTAR